MSPGANHVDAVYYYFHSDIVQTSLSTGATVGITVVITGTIALESWLEFCCTTVSTSTGHRISNLSRRQAQIMNQLLRLN